MPERKASLWMVVLAFATVYVVWGSTYLAIKIAVGVMPPLFMAGVRFIIAGAILLAFNKLKKVEKPTALEWRNASVIGLLMLLMGNGGVCLAETRVASGIVALLVSTVPLWLVLIPWLFMRGPRPGILQVAGLSLGLLGIGLLIMPAEGTAQAALGKTVDILGVLTVVIGSLGWATGTLVAKRAVLPKTALLANGMEMFAGGVGLLVASALTGEFSRVKVNAFTGSSLLALAYLIVFGSILAFSAYIWLNGVTTPARLGTYAYVNPVVAVLLGWGFMGEPLSLRAVLAMLVIISGVVMLSLKPKARAEASLKIPPVQVEATTTSSA